MIKPITPNEVDKLTVIPEFVIKAFNFLITKHFDGRESRILQKDIVKLIKKEQSLTDCKEDPFDNKWLDVEPIYENAGWDVEYDKPAYCENYDASFTFTKREKK